MELENHTKQDGKTSEKPEDKETLLQEIKKEIKEELKTEELRPKFTKRQIRSKLYYLKKSGQTNKYKRYLRQYRDYHSEDEEEDQLDDNSNFILSDDDYEKIRKALITDFKPLQIETLQKFFNMIGKNKNLLQDIIYFFKDRMKLADKL